MQQAEVTPRDAKGAFCASEVRHCDVDIMFLVGARIVLEDSGFPTLASSNCWDASLSTCSYFQNVSNRREDRDTRRKSRCCGMYRAPWLVPSFLEKLANNTGPGI
jgi:hypothetical protein